MCLSSKNKFLYFFGSIKSFFSSYFTTLTFYIFFGLISCVYAQEIGYDIHPEATPFNKAVSTFEEYQKAIDFFNVGNNLHILSATLLVVGNVLFSFISENFFFHLNLFNILIEMFRLDLVSKISLNSINYYPNIKVYMLYLLLIQILKDDCQMSNKLLVYYFNEIML